MRSRTSSVALWVKIARLPGRPRPSAPASSTVTGRPRERRARAAVMPTGPAPATRTSGDWDMGSHLRVGDDEGVQDDEPVGRRADRIEVDLGDVGVRADQLADGGDRAGQCVAVDWRGATVALEQGEIGRASCRAGGERAGGAWRG